MDQLNKTPAPLPATPRNDSELKRGHFTPCRRLGLKRKSMQTPELAAEVALVTPNSSFKNHKHSFETPRRVIAFSDTSPKEMTRTVNAQDIETEILPEESKKDVEHIHVSKIRLNTVSKKCTPQFRQKAPSEEMIAALQKTVKEKEERLAALNKQIVDKNQDLDADLTERTEKWRAGCQKALYRLHEKTKSLGNEITMTEMVSKLGIPFDVINYDADLEDFQEL